MRDLANSISVVETLASATRTADADGTGVDLQGFESATVVAHFGAEGITLSTSNKIEMKLEHSDDNVTFSAVTSASDVVDGTVDASGIFATADGNDDIPAVFTIGYVGGKRYIRAVIDYSGTHGTGTPAGATVIKGHPRHTSDTDGA